MNENFCQALQESGLSVYALAAKSGVPYTTVYKLAHDKMNINKISAETLSRLAINLNKTMDDLLNPYFFMDGSRGSCHRISYEWKHKSDKGLGVAINIEGEEYFEPVTKEIVRAKNREWYDLIAEMAVRKYIRVKTFSKIKDAYKREV